MPFRRRKPAAFVVRLREAIWPKKGFLRGMKYLRLRALRVVGSPHAVAAGISAGVMASWTPFLGFHVVSAFGLAFLLRGSLVAALLGTTLGNPLTFAVIWPLSWQIGNVMLGSRQGEPHPDLANLLHQLSFSQLWKPVLEPMALGCVPPALLSGMVFYALTYASVLNFRRRRHERLTERTRMLKSDEATLGA